MKNNFIGYYRPSDFDFSILWDNCIFSFDANVLLNLYRYSTKTCADLLDILDKISDRLWLPFQVGIEYQVNRLEVIQKQQNAYSDIINNITQIQNNMESYLNNYLKHPFIEVKPLIDKTKALFSKITEELKTQGEKHPDLIGFDILRDRITDIFNGKVGGAYNFKRLKDIYDEGQKRYEKCIPPGYSDSERKKGENKYGDLILWFQLIDKSIELQKPFIFITDETKEDWWWIFKGRTIGPRPELIEEFHLKTNQDLYIYSSYQFMEYARQYLKQHVEEKAINEVRELRETDIIDSLKFITKLYQDKNIKNDLEIIKLYQERDVYEEHMSAIQNEITSIVKKMHESRLSESYEMENETNELTNRYRYLKRDFNSIQENINNIYNKIEELKSREESNKKFLNEFQYR
ncbi:MAG: PIN-like domain-containing protein [Syntrophobacterales bacterium]|jgi:hypothetical protein|nr:PIN-like domain-containing protein [Syntrophobacterales bacterium]